MKKHQPRHDVPHTTHHAKALLLAVPFGESVALLAFLGAPAPWNFADRSFRSGSTLNSWRSIDDLLLTIGEYLLMILNDIEWYWWILMIYWWFIADNRWSFFSISATASSSLAQRKSPWIPWIRGLHRTPKSSNQQSSIIVHLPWVIKP
jgi:hypothetical protein